MTAIGTGTIVASRTGALHLRAKDFNPTPWAGHASGKVGVPRAGVPRFPVGPPSC